MPCLKGTPKIPLFARTFNVKVNGPSVIKINKRSHVGSLVHPELAAEPLIVLNGRWTIDQNVRHLVNGNKTWRNCCTILCQCALP